MALVNLLRDVARRKGTTPAQIALAYVLAQRPSIVPTPGTTKLHCLDENLGAAAIELTVDDLQQIHAAASKVTVQGARLPEAVLRNDRRPNNAGQTAAMATFEWIIVLLLGAELLAELARRIGTPIQL